MIYIYSTAILAILFAMALWVCKHPFKTQTFTKKVLNTLAIACMFFLTLTMFQINTFYYNYQYNYSAKIMTNAIIEALNKGDTQALQSDLNEFNSSFNANYMEADNFTSNANLLCERINTRLAKSQKNDPFSKTPKDGTNNSKP